MKCTDCVYYWADIEEYVGEDGNTHARTVGNEYCHYAYNDGYAPCEVEDSEPDTPYGYCDEDYYNEED